MRRHAAVVIVLLGASVASAAPVKATWGSSLTNRKYEAKALTSVLQGSLDKMRLCATGAARASVKFTIGADGKTTEWKVTDVSEAIAQCVSATLAKLVFAKPADGQPVAVTVPLAFTIPEIKQGAAFVMLTGSGGVSSGSDEGNMYGGLIGDEPGEMQGGYGYGRSGFGPGGGGTGWGTIGTGKYGTIGHGSGTSSGYGVGGGRGGMRGKNASVPTVSIGQPNANGDLDKAIIRRYVKRNIQKITYCYEKRLLEKKGLTGTVTAEFTITSTGLVTGAKASGMDTDVGTCVAGVIAGIEFPRPKTGGSVAVTYPFTFRPADQ